MDLYDTSTEEDIHINQTLIDYGFAVFQEESHASKARKDTIALLNYLYAFQRTQHSKSL